MNQSWNDTREELRRHLGTDLYDRHFSGAVLQHGTADELIFVLHDETTALLVETKYHDLVDACVRAATGRAYKLRYTYSASAEPGEAEDSPQLSLFPSAQGPSGPPRGTIKHNAPRKRTEAKDLRERAMECGLAYHYDFPSFIVGGSNNLAFQTARVVAERPGSEYNPLFIYGGVGLGKTHLMNAIGLHALEVNPKLRVRYLSAETFLNEFVEAIGARRMNEFRRRNRVDIDVLLIDDIQFMRSKEGIQEELFHTFNALFQSGRQIVMTSDRVPSELPELEERLRSRFSMGLLADVQPPDFETRCAILKRRAEQMSCVIPQEAISYIAEHVRSNVRELHGALIRIGTIATVDRAPITLDVVRAQLDMVIHEDAFKVTNDVILKATCDVFGVTARELKGRKRPAKIAVPRKVAMFLMRKHTASSYPELGAFFGGRDHTTVMSGVQSVESLIADNDPIRKRIETIERKIGLVR